MSRSPSHKSERWFAVVVASVCLLAQLYPLLHFALVPHVRCAAHGELLEAEAHPPARSDVAADDRELTVLQTTEEDSDAHEHEHCRLISERRDVACERSCPRYVARQPFVTVTADVGTLACVRPLFRLAPKLSPPARS